MRSGTELSQFLMVMVFLPTLKNRFVVFMASNSQETSLLH